MYLESYRLTTKLFYDSMENSFSTIEKYTEKDLFRPVVEDIPPIYPTIESKLLDRIKTILVFS